MEDNSNLEKILKFVERGHPYPHIIEALKKLVKKGYLNPVEVAIAIWEGEQNQIKQHLEDVKKGFPLNEELVEKSLSRGYITRKEVEEAKLMYEKDKAYESLKSIKQGDYSEYDIETVRKAIKNSYLPKSAEKIIKESRKILLEQTIKEMKEGELGALPSLKKLVDEGYISFGEAFELYFYGEEKEAQNIFQEAKENKKLFPQEKELLDSAAEIGYINKEEYHNFLKEINYSD